MGIPAIATPATQRGDDVQHQLARLDRVVEQLRALERSRNSTSARGRELAEAVPCVGARGERPRAAG